MPTPLGLTSLLEAALNDPLYWGTAGTTIDVPGTWDVALAGHGYMIDSTFEFGRRDSFRHSSIAAQRSATDITNEPGEATINPQGLWRSEMNDWSMGSGQRFVDRNQSIPNRFHHSQGIDCFTTKWNASLLKDTALLVADANVTCQVLVCGAYLFKLNSSGVGFSTNGSTYTAVTGLTGTPVMMASDGVHVYIACGTGGLYVVTAPTASATSALLVSGNNVYFVGWASNVLFAADATTNGLYQLHYTGTQITVWPTILGGNPSTSQFTWNSICGGNGWIYIGGYAGSSLATATASAIYKTQFEPDGTTLTAPTVATPLPPGEIAYSLYAFVNFILIGTSLGVRFCETLGVIASSGQDTGLLKIGPVIPNLQEPTTRPVRCFTANQRFVYFGWSNYSAATGNAPSTCTGLGWLDVSSFTGDQTPAYSSNLMVNGVGEITSMDWFNGAPVFVVQGVGVYTAASTYVASGSIQSGYIGFRIPDQKILIAYTVDTYHAVTPSLIGASIMQDDTNNYPLGNVSVVGGGYGQFSLPTVYGELFEITTTLYASNSDTFTPALRRTTLQAFPAITAGKNIIAALRFYDQVATRAGSRAFDVYGELAFLEQLRYEQQVINYQEGTTSWAVVIDDIDMVWYEPSELPHGGFQGICMVTMKTATSGLIV